MWHRRLKNISERRILPVRLVHQTSDSPISLCPPVDFSILPVPLPVIPDQVSPDDDGQHNLDAEEDQQDGERRSIVALSGGEDERSHNVAGGEGEEGRAEDEASLGMSGKVDGHEGLEEWPAHGVRVDH